MVIVDKVNTEVSRNGPNYAMAISAFKQENAPQQNMHVAKGTGTTFRLGGGHTIIEINLGAWVPQIQFSHRFKTAYFSPLVIKKNEKCKKVRYSVLAK